MAPLDSAKKALLLKRLAEGRAKAKASRASAKEKGLPDPKPRKPRAKKAAAGAAAPAEPAGLHAAIKAASDDYWKNHAHEYMGREKGKHAEYVDNAAVVNPLANKPARESIPPISGAPPGATNAVGSAPVDPSENATSKIDVPNLPDKEGRKMIVEDPEEPAEAKPVKGVSATGKPEKYNNNVILTNEETGNQAIPAQYPGQEESILKLLKKNKRENKPLAAAANPMPTEKTVDNVTHHVRDIKAVEARAPFSFSAIRKVLYQ